MDPKQPDTSPDPAPATGAENVSEPSQDMGEVLRFDPFAPPPKPEQPAGETGATAETGAAEAQPAAAGAAAPVAPTPTPAPTQAEPSPLEKAIATNTEAIRTIMAQQAMQQQPAQQPATPEAAAGPKFNLGIPDQIVNAIASEDPKERSVALHAVVNGVANHVWQQTETLVRGVVQEILQSVPQMIQGQQDLAKRQAEVAEDFYGTYEVFKKPEFVPLMQNIGMQIAQEMVASGRQPQWNAQMRDAIAERMFTLFPMLKAVHDTAAAARAKGGNGVQPAKRQQPFATGTGARPAAEPVNEMEAILKLF